MSEFVHLHNHSDYSLLDGAFSVDNLVGAAVENDMSAVALTEHGNLFSAIQFYKKAKQAGVKPIFGCELYVAQKSRFEKKTTNRGGWGYNHLVVLAKNKTGWKNLMKLVSFGYLEGFYYRPRVDKELLRQYSDGLIASAACLKGSVQEKILDDDYEGAKKEALEHYEIFQGDYFLELQRHFIEAEDIVREGLKKISKETGIPMIVTNDSHYMRKEHHNAHDALICIGSGKLITDQKRISYATPEFYFKTQDEMFDLFPDDIEAMERTAEVAEMCNVDIEMGNLLLPEFPIPEDEDVKEADGYLRKLTEEGARDRYGSMSPEIQERMDHELGIIENMGFAGYFLITRDFVQYARDKDIPVGPGRGSAAGSLVAYALEITDIDPLEHDLLFERFLNPERVSMPDIDIDFCYNRRNEVIEYIRDRYGGESVSQIITFGTMKAKAVLRDVGRVLGMSYGEVDRIAKLVPNTLGISLEEAIGQVKELQEVEEQDGDHKKLIEYSKVLEGMHRHASIHAAGVVIAPGELTDYVPLYKSTDGDVTTQWDMVNLEEVGLLKMDFLGLRTLTVIQDAVDMVRDSRGIEIDIDEIPMDDQKVYKTFADGNTTGVFQFESSGMKEYLRKLKPNAFEDLIAMNALYRPGPMDMIDDYIARKHGKAEVEYIHPSLEPILEDTYGIIVYQEQVMQIAHQVAGFSLAKADIMRKAMGKKKQDVMDKLASEFVDGAVENGLEKATAEEIFDHIVKFAQYGFNKSHSTAYAQIAYKTAYLKTYYPEEFMAANLTSEMTDTDRVVILTNDCRKMGVEVLPPDVNSSEANFFPRDNAVVFGLNAIKNVGLKAAENIAAVRKEDGPYESIFDFVKRVDLRLVNRKVLESLNKAGAMDSLPGNRAQRDQIIESALQFGQRYQAQMDDTQVDLFGTSAGGVESVISTPSLPDTPEWGAQERMKEEKALIGFYLTGHPLQKYEDVLNAFNSIDMADPESVNGKENVRVGGMVSDMKIHYTKRGNKEMAFVTLEGLQGQAELVVFPDTYAETKNILKPDNMIFIEGRLSDQNRDDDEIKLIASKIIPLEQAQEKFAKNLHISVEVDKMKVTDVEDLKRLTARFDGDCGLLFHINTATQNTRIVRANSFTINPDQQLISRLRNRFGTENVWFD
ncbi:MAG: DNA polymerase III subunit alpha [Candidatus Marinimicrobia bacterium]|nr:DNA polymerase III subunit alpha [Candidatus Neomarinimicrobiota bacterium]MCF7828840.1 DNA polymerase III subunit alpha [Candidatus Neomarinimicrobiota bacterium]MCF7880757.1 DNA polymerase III subunit alpha [Candidatus Neomarinimicrobiota bacterium]